VLEKSFAISKVFLYKCSVSLERDTTSVHFPDNISTSEGFYHIH